MRGSFPKMREADLPARAPKRGHGSSRPRVPTRPAPYDAAAGPKGRGAGRAFRKARPGRAGPGSLRPALPLRGNPHLGAPRKGVWRAGQFASTILDSQSNRDGRGTREAPEGRARGKDATRRVLHTFREGGQAKTLSGSRRGAASRGAEGARYRASFAGETPTCGCACHAAGKGRRHTAGAERMLPIRSQPAGGKSVAAGMRR